MTELENGKRLPSNWEIMTDEEKKTWAKENLGSGVGVTHFTDDQGQKRVKVDVEIDANAMERLIERNKNLEAELEEERILKEDYETKLKLIAEEKLSKKAKALGLGPFNPHTDEPWTIDELRAVEGSRMPFDGDKKGASGQARLTPSQLGKSSGKSFESHKDLINYLTEQEHGLDPQERKEASAIKDELFKRQLEAIKSKSPDYQGFTLEIDKPLTEWKEKMNKEAQKFVKEKIRQDIQGED